MNTKNFVFKGFKSVELNRIYFVNSLNWDDTTNNFLIRSILKIEKNSPDSFFAIRNCKFHRINIVVTFSIDDLYNLEI